jgi:hypothetical protein
VRPRALEAVLQVWREVALGLVGGALGLALAARGLAAFDRERALILLVALATWVVLLVACVRVARAAPLRPWLALPLVGAPALFVVGPVAKRMAFSVGEDPVARWSSALAGVQEALDPTTLAGGLVAAALVPFLLVGVPLAARPRAPAWALATLAVAGAHLGIALAVTRGGVPVVDALATGGRHALLGGVPLAVLGLALARPRRGRRAALLWMMIPLALAALVAREHVRHLVRGARDGYDRWGGLAGSLHDLGQEALPELVASMDSPDEGWRRVVAWHIAVEAEVRGWRLDRAPPALVQRALDDPERAVRVRCLVAIASVAPTDPEVHAALIEVVATKRFERETASDALLRAITDPRVTLALRDRLDERRAGDDPRALLRCLSQWTTLRPERTVDGVFDALIPWAAELELHPAELSNVGAPDGHRRAFDAALERAAASADPRVRDFADEALRGLRLR